MKLSAILIFVLSFISLRAFCNSSNPVEIKESLSFYLGEKKEMVLKKLPEATDLEWSLDNSNLLGLDAGELIQIEPQKNNEDWGINLAVPYISPSFSNREVTLLGRDIHSQETKIKVILNLTVRAELVIQFRERSENSFTDFLPSSQMDSDFQWDIPINKETAQYQPIVVNNHKKGLWVRFRYSGYNKSDSKRSAGYLIHIYRGEGEYIVHQPFKKETHLMTSDCRFDPISEEEWKNPVLGLQAEGKSWANCEFRGFVPEGLAYGFGFREHYLESAENEKFVEIKNVGELNTELIEYYQFMEESGLGDPLSAMCTTW